MKALDCGCELTPTGALGSLCTMHGEYMRAASAIAVRELGRPRNAEHTQAVNEERKGLERELLVAIAPEVVRRFPVGKHDPNTAAQQAFDHVQEIMRRLE